ncbi:MAG: hypothetical protein ACLQOO_19175 [Terriglobia bacterium]
MNLALSSHVLMAHWVPGFLLVMAVRPMLLDGSSPPLKSLMGSGTPGDAIATLAVAVGAFFVGEVLDASRDLLENVWDWFQPVAWDFFAKAGKDEVDQLRTSYFTYYAFDCNVSLALAILLLSHFVAPLFHVSVNLGNSLVVLFLVTFLIVFVWNGRQLRREIASLTQRWLQQ